MGIEIEIKLKLVADIATNVLSWLDKYACKLLITKQRDTYFEPDAGTYIYVLNGIKKADKWLRIREEDNVSSVCYKQWHRDTHGNTLFADEFETNIENVEIIKALIKSLGFHVLITVDKERFSWVLRDFEVSIDKVSNLGYFLEIEYKGKDFLDPLIVKQMIYNLISEMGIFDYEEDELGYPALLLNL